MKIIQAHRIATLFCLLFIPTLVFAHVHIEKSTPAPDETLAVAPTTVQLWFSGNVEAEFSKIEVKDSNGNRVDQQKISVIPDSPKGLQVNLNPLTSGKYEVTWSIVSTDGHRIKGSMTFHVK